MRIIAGQRRGLILTPFEQDTIRPTKDLVKTYMFNILANHVDISQCRVLDLFSGSGNLALEALSRGAVEAVMIDQDSRAADIIRKNIAKTHFESQSEIRTADAKQVLETVPKVPFDIIFADPPYAEKLGDFVVDKVSANRYLAPRGILILETAPGEPFRESYPGVVRIKQKKWGESLVTIYQNSV